VEQSFWAKDGGTWQTKARCVIVISNPKQRPNAWTSAEIFLGGWDEVDISFIIFRLLTMQCKWTFTKRFILSKSQRKCPMLPHQSQKCALLAAMLLTPYKTTWLTAVSTHCLAALHAIAVCVEQSHVVLPLCCYAKALDCTIKTQDSQKFH